MRALSDDVKGTDRQVQILKILGEQLWRVPHEISFFTAPDKCATGDKRNPRLSMVIATLKVTLTRHSAVSLVI